MLIWRIKVKPHSTIPTSLDYVGWNNLNDNFFYDQMRTILEIKNGLALSWQVLCWNELPSFITKERTLSVDAKNHCVYLFITAIFSCLGQLFWREYFYVMSVPNPNFDKMKSNPICLNIPWARDLDSKENLKKWKAGKTGYPFIDAAMRQLVQEGWLHHVTRNAVACFLTRSDLWITWTKGLQFFLK